MKKWLVVLVVMLGVGIAPAVPADPVPLPCKIEDCPPIDPCKINPDRCKDKGGPISNEATLPSAELTPVGYDYSACIRSCDRFYDQCVTRNGNIAYCSGQHDSCRNACLRR